MKTLYLGGSFNPIHHGHLICARAAMEHADYQRVALIPSAWPPHKSRDTNLAAPEHRLRMCQLAVQHTATFTVDDIELQRTARSYTLDTVRELKKRGVNEVHWLIGADMLNFLPEWHKPLELLQEVHFVVMARPGVPMSWSAWPEAFRVLQNHVVEVPQIDISSTDIRTRVRAGLSFEYLTPREVVEYIQQQNLYR